MKNSRDSLLAVGVCILVCLTLLSVYAQDTKANPYVGTWKLNVAKSDFGKMLGRPLRQQFAGDGGFNPLQQSRTPG
jgi:hypothetical protein